MMLPQNGDQQCADMHGNDPLPLDCRVTLCRSYDFTKVYICYGEIHRKTVGTRENIKISVYFINNLINF